MALRPYKKAGMGFRVEFYCFELPIPKLLDPIAPFGGKFKLLAIFAPYPLESIFTKFGGESMGTVVGVKGWYVLVVGGTYGVNVFVPALLPLNWPAIG